MCVSAVDAHLSPNETASGGLDCDCVCVMRPRPLLADDGTGNFACDRQVSKIVSMHDRFSRPYVAYSVSKLAINLSSDNRGRCKPQTCITVAEAPAPGPPAGKYVSSKMTGSTPRQGLMYTRET